MEENEQKQQLSVAYLHAVASAAGFACQAPGLDDDSVDRTIVGIEQDDRRMVSRYAAYYVSLAGMEDAPQKGKVPVELPRINLFSVGALRRLMEQASRRVRSLR